MYGGGSFVALSSAAHACNCGTGPGASSTHPLFRFGVIADVQWADLEDGHNYARTTKRCSRRVTRYPARAS